MKTIALTLLALVSACSSEEFGTSTSALTADQCSYFQVDGRVEICHYTGAAKKPYTILRVANESCVDGHADHAGDYVAVGDPTCGGLGCLPSGAPCDATVPCCAGNVCSEGVCTPQAVGTTTVFRFEQSVGYVGTWATFYVAVIGDDGGAPTGTVEFVADGPGESCKSEIGTDGVTQYAKCSFMIAAVGTRQVTATYLGDASYSSSSAVTSVVVDK